MKLMSSPFPSEALKRAALVKLLVLDVDGVLTDGSLIYGEGGEAMKIFNVQDGTGQVLLIKSGVELIWITGRKSAAVDIRGKEIGVNAVFQGIRDKLSLFSDILKEKGLVKEQTACMCDDLQDISLMVNVGLAAAPSNARPEVKHLAHYVSSRPGGKGAVRDLCDLILKARGEWENILERF